MKRSRSRSVSPGRRVAVAAFLFRRDLRASDNLSLSKLLRAAQTERLPVIPLFFFNPIQADPATNAYFGHASFQFMCQSLVDLNQQLLQRLVCLRGGDAECLDKATRLGLDIKMIGFNEDFSPFARRRDTHLKQYCTARNIQFITSAEDYTLLPLGSVVSQSEEPYSVFTPFYRRVMADHLSCIKAPQKPLSPQTLEEQLWKRGPPFFSDEKFCVDPSSAFTPIPTALCKGGRAEGLAILCRMKSSRLAQEYADHRDIPSEDRTTHWSPHLKFGTLSVRECWQAVLDLTGAGSELARQLIWREFYSTLLHHRPELVGGQVGLKNQPFQAKYEKFKWIWRDEHFTAFKLGRTGVPLVDASVRCLQTTGWCPNRCRMVIGNYLVKTLGVDWREGEKWYASLAVDYDVANNSGGWLWCSGQGADAQPFFRTFNPFRQSLSFDADCRFIHRWVPELAGLSPSVIHRWEEACLVVKSTTAASKKTAKPIAAEKERIKEILASGAYVAPLVPTRESTAAVIDRFKSHNASLQ